MTKDEKFAVADAFNAIASSISLDSSGRARVQRAVDVLQKPDSEVKRGDGGRFAKKDETK